MNLSISPPPFAGAPVVVLSAGLGGSGSYWLPQLADLEQDYQVVCYDQRGTGNNPAELPEDYSLAQMADELWQALSTAGIGRFSVIGHALGALIGLQLAVDRPEAIDALVCVNGWLTLHPHTRRCFQVRERLLHAGGAQAWVEAQPLFLYPADWMAARQPRMEAEEALALAHFQGKATLLRRLSALKRGQRLADAASPYPALFSGARATAACRWCAGVGRSSAVVPLSRRLDGRPSAAHGGRRGAGAGPFSG